MKQVIFPLQLESRGDAVANLQDALRFLLDRAIIRIPQPERSEVEARLNAERERSVFGEQTNRLVRVQQEFWRLEPNGIVDERTASLLNAELLRDGALERQPSRGEPAPVGEEVAERALPLLRTSAMLRESEALERFVRLVADHDVSALHGWTGLAHEAGFSDGEIEEAKLTVELAWLTAYDLPLIDALQELRGRGRIRSVRDFVDLSPEEWRSLMGDRSASDIEARVASLNAKLAEKFPTPYVARALAVPPAVDLAVVRRVAKANPRFDLSTLRPDNLAFPGFRDDERQSAISSLAALHREIIAFPDLDPNPLLQTEGDVAPRVLNPIRADVARFLAQAQDFDLRTTRLGPYVAEHPAVTEGLSNVSLAIAQMQRMQRVFRVAPSFEGMSELMGEGIHSAFRITRMPADVFVARFDGRLGSAMSAQAVYAAARMVTATTAALAWAVRLRSAGPLPAAVGAWPPPPLAIEDAELRELLQSGRRTNHS